MQSASDIFLGWTESEKGRQFYIRQLKDMKIKPMVEVLHRSVMIQYAEICGWTLAHAHARSGEPAKISGYLGKSDKFDEAIANFSVAYADQSERDHEVLMKAVFRDQRGATLTHSLGANDVVHGQWRQSDEMAFTQRGGGSTGAVRAVVRGMRCCRSGFKKGVRNQ